PDGSRGVLVTNPGNLIAFDAATGRVQDTGVKAAWPWTVRYSADGKHVALASEDWRTHLRIVSAGGNWGIQDFGEFGEDLEPIKPTADGGFLVTTSVVSFGLSGPNTVGIRWRPGHKDLEELWRLPGNLAVNMRMDFDPERLIGVRTRWDLVTDVIDLKTG